VTSSRGIDIDQYKTQAKDLLRAARSGTGEALGRLRTNRPEAESLFASARIQLADVQLVIARENGFGSWAKFKEHLLLTWFVTMRRLQSPAAWRCRHCPARSNPAPE
jgi:hypothetical protein